MLDFKLLEYLNAYKIDYINDNDRKRKLKNIVNNIFQLKENTISNFNLFKHKLLI